MRRLLFSRWLCAGALGALASCASPESESVGRVSLGGHTLELDDMDVAPAGMELFVLAEGADLERVRAAFARIEGELVHVLPPRLLLGKVPAGSEAILRDAGVLSRFARAVTSAEVGAADTREARFVRLFSSRYYPDATPREERVVPQRLRRAEGEAFERAPEHLEGMSLRSAASEGDEQAEAQEANVFVPFASGRVVVSIILPESNGVGEPDTETWSEDAIVETYAKIQAALEGIARHEPNAKLDFVLHYESAPKNGGLEGTVDCDWEFGHAAAGAEFQSKAYAQLYANILGREVGEFDYYAAQREYLQGLKTRYAADGAFVVYVAANQNYTAGFRAYAYFNGPQTMLDSSYGYNTFMHEFGHIFGAMDEYCPDACISPNANHGYLGIVNANAQFMPGSYGGIKGGRGESAPSLMMANLTNGVNGYTRGAFGWLDTDGDGLLEVRDTTPRSHLRAEVRDGEVHLVGRIIDMPATSNGFTPFSVNRIAALHVRAGGDWVRLPIAGQRRGREDVDIVLGKLGAGSYAIELRSENSVGNLEPTPSVVRFDVTGSHNAAPLVALTAPSRSVSTRASITVTASVHDFEGDSVRLRFDVDGDGRYDTALSNRRTASVTPRRAGMLNVGVEAVDARGKISHGELALDVFEGNAPATVELAALPSPLHGSASQALLASARIRDAEGDATSLTYELARDDFARSFSEKTAPSAPAAHTFQVATPPSLASYGINLQALDATIDRWTTVHDAVRLDENRVVLALGELGIAIVDTRDVSPRLLARLALEVSAIDLALVSGKLFVLGDKLTVVDVANPEAPVEIPQRKATKNQRVTSYDEAWSIPEAPEKGLPMWAASFERIEHVRLEVALTHPAWQELRLALTTPTGESIVIWDHARRARNQRSIVVTDQTLPALRSLIGTRHQGDFRLEVLDDVANGSNGTLSSVKLSFDTVHNAYQADIEDLRSIVGPTRDGKALVLAGAGIETVELTKLDQLKQGARLVTAPVLNAQIVQDNLFGLTHEAPTVDKQGRPIRPPAVRGLFAFEVAARRLRSLRIDTSVLGEGFAVAGTRFYVSGGREQVKTSVGSLDAFVSGRRYWLGETAQIVLGSDLIGDDRTLWSGRGAFERWDVANPLAITQLERFDDPIAYGVRFFDERTAFVVGPAGELARVNLAERKSTLSEVYRITAYANDGRVTSDASRSVHVIPYDHAPSVDGARLAGGSTTRDEFQLEVRVTDPDGHPTWDSFLSVRIDWDGDGSFDGTWQSLYDVATFFHRYSEAGDYDVRVQARDGFYALSEVVTLRVHVDAYVPIACSDSSACPAGEFCDLGESCGNEGVCERVRDDCYGFADPVCGCDGATYRSACEAEAQGASVASYGVCPGEVTRCGGPDAATCTVPGQFCRFEPGEGQSCGVNQAFGDCVYAPSQCFGIARSDRVGIPRPQRAVCGCDGQTYASGCAADQAGVSIEFYGTCEGGPDCLETGCAEGSVCTSCFGGFSCLPEGAHC